MESQPFFVRQLIRMTHLRPGAANLAELRAILTRRTNPRRVVGNDREVAVMALAAAQQLGMEHAEIRHWTQKICEEILRNGEAISQIEQGLAALPEQDDRCMIWFSALESTARDCTRHSVVS